MKHLTCRICLADAERLAIRRLLSRSYNEALLSSGPPLPTSHPSPSLLSKLQLNIHSLYASALSLLPNNINSDLKSYVESMVHLNLGLGMKWLGVNEGERNSVGESVGWLELSEKELEETLKKGKIKANKEFIHRELEMVKRFHRASKRDNDTFSFQSVPKTSELLNRIPTGRSALTSKSFNPPPLLFGPGIDRSKRVKEPDLSMSGLNLEDESDSGDDSNVVQGNYSGKGAYF